MSRRAVREPRASAERLVLHRGWLMSAALTLAERDGLSSASVARILGRAHVTRRAFQEAFSDAEDCLHAAIAQALEAAGAEAAGAYRSSTRWEEGIRAALHTLLALAEQRPGLARLVLVELPAGGPRLLDLRADALRGAAEAIAIGGEQPRARSRDPLLAGALAGGIAELLRERLRTGGSEPLTELTGPMAGMIVGVYLGPAAGARELALSASEPQMNGALALPRERTARAAIGLRLTDRTIKVLLAIDANPGASNIEIARAAGIADPAQASKLLARLATRGVAENRAPGGARKSWRLTPLGREICAAATDS